MSPQMAAAARVRRLYHYQSFDLCRLRQVVHGGLIYCSRPQDFNDPWDCKPWYNSNLNDQVMLGRYIQSYVRSTQRHCPSIPSEEVQRRAKFFAAQPAELARQVDEISKGMEQEINRRYRVYCLTTKANSELMWAHYSDKHQGICLEFDTDNAVFGGALKVSYRSDYPLFDLAAESDEDNLAPLLTKSAAWEYEDEYRLVAQEQNAATNHDTLITREGFLALPVRALTAIIIGCMAPATMRQTVANIIEQSGGTVELKVAERATDRYELSIVACDIKEN